MAPTSNLEQHMAVFGESGSGKTVMLSSFYGATQEPEFLKKSLFHVVAADLGDGARLHRNYLGMRDSGRVPQETRFGSTSHSFNIKLKDSPSPGRQGAKPFESMRLVWHDYPGSWFEGSVTGPEEAHRRIDTFRTLLSADVALLLVDGQRLLDNAGEEERYLRSLLANFRNGFLALKDDILDDGKPLVQFPRIWLLALSKADLFPDMNVYKFRDLVIEKAADDLVELKDVIAGFVEAREALSVGEDYLIISSAKFDSDSIEVSQRIGLDVVLPLAATLPIERHARWIKTLDIPRRVAEGLAGNSELLARAILSMKIQLPGPLGALLNLVGPSLLQAAASLAGEQLRTAHKTAVDRHDNLTAMLTHFRIDLETAQDRRVFHRSL
ncbi:ATP/GTP-binding protein [Micrococcus luteus]|nr:ATP/GTP-binding protein [Micrococcus luteus]MCV7545762.1 ATP/GTP-binding protein [Micrococcus luteus]MCV7561008.1 ATP/GTP-binding protein [Micrococcus luteus]